jgi:hypothetical protein
MAYTRPALRRQPLEQLEPVDRGRNVNPLGYTVQDWMGAQAMPDPLRNFEGINNVNGLSPPDTQGDVGPHHYVQWVNVSFAIWDKGGNLLYGPVNGNTLWDGFGGACETTNDGDPVTLYDPLADRWLMSQFALPNYPNGPFYECIAISQSGDPTGAWYRYAFGMPSNKMNDYPKLGVWPDAYYMSANQYTTSSMWGGVAVAAFDRAAMLNGDTDARMVFFDVGAVDSTFDTLLPADLDGPNPPPADAPGYFVAWADDYWHGIPEDTLYIWEFHVDWEVPTNSRFGLANHAPSASVPTEDVDPNLCGFSFNCIPQPITSQKVDAIPGWLMHRLQYRNFGGYETLVSNHTVDVNGADHAGIHWFELRRQQETWALHQEGIYAPDTEHRWMGSIAIDHVGNLALGYSVSSISTYPSIRYTGRLAADPLGTLPLSEAELIAGGGSQTNSNRWGDYSMMAVDPVDDCTFWYTQEYYQTTSAVGWQTRIGAFRFPNCTTGEAIGTLTGVVYEAGETPTTAPIQNAQITALASPTRTFQATTNQKGAWTVLLPAGTYTVTAEAFGYHPKSLTNVSVTMGATTTQLISLTMMTHYVVSGTVTDAEAGWPLYTSIEVATQDFALLPYDIWTDPTTGFYSLTLPASEVYTIYAKTWITGYIPTHTRVSPLVGHQTHNIQLHPDLQLCAAPGYAKHQTSCERQEGGLVIGHVYDDNTNLPLNTATITHTGGQTTWTRDTPDDPAVDAGFYILFSPTGTHTITATTAGANPTYGPVSATVTVTLSHVTSRNLRLPAGWLVPYMGTVFPNGYDVEMQQGVSTTLPLTLTNRGRRPATFELEITTPLLNGKFGNNGGYGLTRPGIYITVPKSTRMGGFTGTATALRAPFRYPAGVDYYDPVLIYPPDVVTPTDVLLLHADTGTEVLTTMLNCYPDIGRVHTITASKVTPTADNLQTYDVVITWSNYPYADPEALGDVLADYVDAGGHVIVMPFAMSKDNWCLGGRFAEEGYMPLLSIGKGNHFATAWLGPHDANHPLLQGVTIVADYFRDIVKLAPDAHVIAAWNNDGLTSRHETFIATKGSVVALNAYGGDGYQWSGDFGIILHNAINYVRTTTSLVNSTGQDIAWVRATPITGTIPACSNAKSCVSTPITLTLDTSVPEASQTGIYQARLLIHDDTPYLLDSLPITMTAFNYGVRLSPTKSHTFGSPGTTVRHMLQITNTGTKTDTFMVSCTGNTWDTKVPATPIQLKASDYTTLTVYVTVPSTGTIGNHDTVTITVISVAGSKINAGISARSVLTTQVAEAAIDVIPKTLSVTMRLNDTVTRPLRIHNIGTAPLTWYLSSPPNVPWLNLTLNTAMLPGFIPAGGNHDINVTFDTHDLNIPHLVTTQDFAPSIYTTTLLITSNDPHQPKVQTKVQLTVKPCNIYLPLVTRTS